MSPLLVPSRTEDRVFPAIGPNFHEEIPPISGEIGRLLKAAVEAERNRLCRRADFFWRELHQAVRSRPIRCASLEPLDADEARRRFVTEVLIEVHCGFYNGWTEDHEPTKPDDRAFAHLDYVLDLHDLSNLDNDAQVELLHPAFVARLNLWLEAGNPTSARKTAEKLLQEFPERLEFLETLIGLHIAETYSQLQGGASEAANKADVRTLHSGLARLHTLLRDHPGHLGLYQAMGHLHHLRAVKLANARDLAQALEQVQRALTYDPSMKEARETRAQLDELMRKLQEEIHKAEVKMVTANPGATMTAEGLRLKRQADLGFDLMEAFAKGPAEKIAHGRQQAEARAVWKAAGLPMPEDRWDERATGLLTAVAEIFDKPPKSQKALRNAWRRKVAANPDLAEIDAAAVHSFLVARLLDSETTEQEAPIEEEEERLADAPVLKIVDGPARHRDIEPFGPWLRSRQGLAVKLQAAAAVLLLVIAGLLAFREARNRTARAELYRESLEAAAHGDYERVIDRVEAFRSGSLLAGDKKREEYLTRLHGEATEIKARVERVEALRQLVTLIGADSETAREIRDRSYEKLCAAVAQKDYQRALEAAERYLATPFFGASDNRKTQVYDLYNEAFVHWFLTQGDDLGDHQVHVDRFRALANV